LSSIYLEKCLVPDPKYGLIKFRLSLCYLKTGQVNESKKLVDELIADFPDSLNILSGVVSTCLMLKDINKATQVSENMGKLYPGNPEVFFVKAKIANAESNIKMADEYYLKALQGIPGDMEIISYLAKRYTDQKLWEKVFPLYKNALEKVPNEPVFLEQLGELYLNCPDVKFRNPDRARYYLERAFYSMKSKNFTRISAGKYLSKLFAQENMLDKAIKVINLTLSIANAGKVPETFIQELEDDLEVYRMLLGKPAMKIN
jgi:tetratricopeptide (TPR) repeat protein